MVQETYLYTRSRGLIIHALLKHKELSIIELTKATNLSSASIYNHLDTLRKNNLVNERIEFHQKGQPRLIRLNNKHRSIKEILSFFKSLYPEVFAESTRTKHKNTL